MIEFIQARRENVSLLIALAGASGSGKTRSALRLAKGMSPNDRIAMIDTDNRRGLHQADKFNFMHLDMRPPFRPARFVEAARAAINTGAEVVIIDNFSDEFDGAGGLAEWADELKDKYWTVPKSAHREMMNVFRQTRTNIIFCLRAEEKIEIVPDPNKPGKTMPHPLGWMPCCEKRFMYEMTVSFTLLPTREARGIPQPHLPHKLEDYHEAFFPDGQLIDEKAGATLAAWARGGQSGVAQLAEQSTVNRSVAGSNPATGAMHIPDDVVEERIEVGHKLAEEGLASLSGWWASLSPVMRKAIGQAQLESWKRTAADVDAGANENV